MSTKIEEVLASRAPGVVRAAPVSSPALSPLAPITAERIEHVARHALKPIGWLPPEMAKNHAQLAVGEMDVRRFVTHRVQQVELIALFWKIRQFHSCAIWSEPPHNPSP